jgi:hypothetical protein
MSKSVVECRKGRTLPDARFAQALETQRRERHELEGRKLSVLEFERASAGSAMIRFKIDRKPKSANKLLTRDPGEIDIIQHMETVCD